MQQSLRIALIFVFLPAIASAQWDAPRKLSSLDTSSHLSENIARCIAASGDTVHVVWWDNKMGNAAIYYRHSFDGGTTWSGITILPGATSLADYPSIAVTGSTVHVTFRDQTGGLYRSYYMRSTDAGITWSNPVSLGVYYFWPSVACEGSNVFVGLNSSATGNTEIWLRRSTDNGNTWDSAIQISHAPGRSEDQGITVSDGYVYLVWNDNRDSANGAPIMQAYWRRSTDNGMTWGAEAALNHPPTGSYFPFIRAQGPNVDFVWGDRRGTFQAYYKHSSDHGATWSSEQMLSSGSGTAGYPNTSRDGANVHVVWSYFNGGTMYRHSSDGGTTWDPAVIIADSQYRTSFSFIESTPTAQHVIWVDSRDGHPGVYYTRTKQADTSKAFQYFGALSSMFIANVRVSELKDTVISIWNAGTAPVTIWGYSMKDSTNSFSLIDSSVHQLLPNSSADIRIGFQPRLAGSFSAILTITTSDSSHIVNNTLIRATAVPRLRISGKASFGDVIVGGTAKTIVTITDSGAAPTTILSMSMNGSSAISIDSQSTPFSIGPWSHAPIMLSFHPHTVGYYSAALFIITTDELIDTIHIIGYGRPDTTSTGSFVKPADPSVEKLDLYHLGNKMELRLKNISYLEDVCVAYYDQAGRLLQTEFFGALNEGEHDLFLAPSPESMQFLRLYSRGRSLGVLRLMQ